MFESKNGYRKKKFFEMIPTELKNDKTNRQKIQKLVLIMTIEVQHEVGGHKELFKAVSDIITLVVSNKNFANNLTGVINDISYALQKLKGWSPEALKYCL